MIIPRPLIESEVRQALARSPAVALLGPRQIGKTTLARQLAGDALYLDLERTSDLRKLDDPRAFLESHSGALTVIDEVHRVPGLFQELRGIIDDRRRIGLRTCQFLLLGSASLDLVQHASETLAGRIGYIYMPPVLATEAENAGITTGKIWLRGGFPESLIAENDSLSFQWRQDFVRSYLERDVPMFAPRIPAATVARLWTMLANAQGTPLNAARLGQGLSISAPTVNRYIDLLDDLLLVRRLTPWNGNLGKRLVRAPKIYLRDSGLCHALLEISSTDQLLGHPIAGPSWEGFVIENLVSAAGPAAVPLYYRTADGAEIDLIFERGGKPHIAIEIKLSSAPKITASFIQSCEKLDIPHRLIVANIEGSYRARESVEIHSLISAMQKIQELLPR